MSRGQWRWGGYALHTGSSAKCGIHMEGHQKHHTSGISWYKGPYLTQGNDSWDFRSVCVRGRKRKRRRKEGGRGDLKLTQLLHFHGIGHVDDGSAEKPNSGLTTTQPGTKALNWLPGSGGRHANFCRLTLSHVHFSLILYSS